MRKTTMFLLAVGFLAAFSSCNERKDLAKKVEGEWASAPVKLANDASGQSTTVDNVIFSIDPATGEGGTVQISSMISLRRPAGTPASPFGPYEVSVAARSSVSGTWKAVDDDEIRIALDYATFDVSVDPDMVDLVSNPLAGTEHAAIDSIRPQMVKFYNAELTRMMESYYSGFADIDDVKSLDNGSTLKMEIADRDYVFTRQK